MNFINLYKIIARYNKSILLCIFSILTECILAQDAQGSYPIINFSPSEYKAGIQNIDFAQNRDMQIFVANNLGILEYEGNEWEAHSLDTGKKFRSLAFDEEKDRLYVGSQGTFGYFEQDWQYRSLDSLLPEGSGKFDEVWDVFILNSMVYFCTFSGIFEYDGTDIRIIQREGGLERSFKVKNSLYTQDPLGNLFEINQNALVPLGNAPDQGNTVKGIIKNNFETTIIYSSGQIKNNSSNTQSHYLDLQDALNGKYINHVTELSDKRIVICTQTDGVYIYNPLDYAVEHISTKNGLLSNTCLKSFQDYAGNLWIGMQNGIAIVDINSAIRHIGNEINLSGSGYDCYERPEGNYYTTSNGIYFKGINEQNATQIPGTEGPGYALVQIGEQLYGCHHKGLFLLDRNNGKLIHASDGLWDLKILKSHPGLVLGGTYSGLITFNLNEENNLNYSGKVEGFEETSRFFEEDNRGNVWVGQFYKGLYLLEPSENFNSVKVKRFEADANGQKLEQIILSRVNEKLYVASKNGLFKINQENNLIAAPEEYFHQLMNQPVHLFKEDKLNNIHVIAENTIGYYRRVSPNNYVYSPSSIYEQKYSLNNDLLNVADHLSEGVMYNSNEGFLLYKPLIDKNKNHNSSPLVSEIFSSTERKSLFTLMPFEKRYEKPLSLKAKENSKLLQFDIDYYSYTGIGNREYRYRLKGFEESFSEWTNIPLKEYSNLKAGDYTFMVQARNHLGETVDGIPITLTIIPPFYKTKPALLLYILIGFSVVYLFFRKQRLKYQKQSKAIEESKMIALAKIEREVKEKEIRKDQELLKLKEEKLEHELNSLQNQLATSTMNLVAKNEFIISIKDKLQVVNKKVKDTESKKTLQNIVKEIDITLKLQEDWEKFEHHFDQVHGDFLARLQNEFPNLSPNEMKLCSFLRLNLNTKDIANLMNISTRGVEIARYRLRKKINLDTGDNLSKFILEF